MVRRLRKTKAPPQRGQVASLGAEFEAVIILPSIVCATFMFVPISPCRKWHSKDLIDPSVSDFPQKIHCVWY
jgi:hypothetical protein